MAIELVTKYLPYVDELFKAESKRSLVTNQDFSWTGAQTIKVYKIGTSAMHNYDRAGTKSGTSRYGEVENLDANTQSMMIKNDRSFTFVIDKLDTDETGRTLEAASALARQLREVTVPEVDSYVYRVMAANAGTKPAPVTLTPENIYDEIIKATTTLDDAEIPEAGRVLSVVPEVYQIMKKSKEIILNSNIGEDMRLKGVISNLDGMSVMKVPSTRMPENFGFMVSHPRATVAPVKLADYKTHQDPPGISGSLVEGRIVYDAFVLDNKKKAIYYQENKPATSEGSTE